jgi:hypothetical protein
MPNRTTETPQDKKVRLAVEGAQAMKEYLQHADAVNERTVRLRAARLAREADTASAPPAKKKASARQKSAR